MTTYKTNAPYSFQPFTGSAQTFTATDAGTYHIAATGAQGGASSGYYTFQRKAGGLGAMASGDIYLAAGAKLSIIVGNIGSVGENASGGGGGGSFVIETFDGKKAVNIDEIIAGGGGGGGFNDAGGGGVASVLNGGAAGKETDRSGGAGGGGFTGGNGYRTYINSTNNTNTQVKAADGSNAGNLSSGGFLGGIAYGHYRSQNDYGTSNGDSYGGFGGFGGGGAGGYRYGGGGGGYGGGNGGDYAYGDPSGGGGGGSYVDAKATNVVETAATNAGKGTVTVTLVAKATIPSVHPATTSGTAGATQTGTAGTAGTGALAGDTDPGNGTLTVTTVNGQGVAAGSTAASNATTVAGTYGTLTIGADGSYSYVADKAVAIVSAADGQAITDTFTDTVASSASGSAASSLTVTVSRAAGAETVTNPTGSATYTIGATTLTLNETADSTFGGVIQDGTGATGGKVVVTGGHTLTLGGASTYTGGTTLDGGTLELTQATSAGTGAITFVKPTGTATVKLALDVAAQPDNGTFANTLTDFNAAGESIDLVNFTTTKSSYTSDGTSLTVDGYFLDVDPTETFTLVNGAKRYTATSDGSHGTLLTPVLAPTVQAETSTETPGTTLAGTGGMGGTGALAGDADPNGGTLSITDATFGGTTTTVAAGSTSATNPTTIVGTYGTLTIGADGSYTYTDTADGQGLAIVTAAGPITDTFGVTVTTSEGTSAASSLAITTSLASGAETVTNPTGTATYTIGATTLTLNETADSTFDGVIQDGTGGTGGKVVVTGGHTLTLTGANTFTGGIALQSGTLELDPADQTSPPSVKAEGSGPGGSGDGAVAFDGSGSATLQIDFRAYDGSGSFDAGEYQAYSGVITGLGQEDAIDLHNLFYDSGSTYTASYVDGSGLVVRQTTHYSYPDGSGGTIDGDSADEVRLTGFVGTAGAHYKVASDGNGGTTGTSGTLVTLMPASPPTVQVESMTLKAGATATGTAGTTGTGALVGDVDNDGGTLSITDATFGGTTTTVAAGSTSATNPTTIVGTYGTLTIGADGSYTYTDTTDAQSRAIVTAPDGPITDSFSFKVATSEGASATSSLTLTTSRAAGGAETVTNPSGSGTYTIGGTTLTLNETADATFGGVIQDGTGATGGKVVVTGGHTLTLTGASTFTGGTTVNAGSTLALSGTGSLTSGVTLVDTGATLTNAGTVAGGIGAGGGTVSNTGTISGYYGVLFNTGDSPFTLTGGGAITGTAAGIYAHDRGGNITLGKAGAALGAVTGTGGNAIDAGSVSGNVSVVTGDAVKSDTGTGIQAGTSGTGSATVTLGTGTTVTGASAGGTNHGAGVRVTTTGGGAGAIYVTGKNVSVTGDQPAMIVQTTNADATISVTGTGNTFTGSSGLVTDQVGTGAFASTISVADVNTVAFNASDTTDAYNGQGLFAGNQGTGTTSITTGTDRVTGNANGVVLVQANAGDTNTATVTVGGSITANGGASAVASAYQALLNSTVGSNAPTGYGVLAVAAGNAEVDVTTADGSTVTATAVGVSAQSRGGAIKIVTGTGTIQSGTNFNAVDAVDGNSAGAGGLVSVTNAAALQHGASQTGYTGLNAVNNTAGGVSVTNSGTIGATGGAFGNGIAAYTRATTGDVTVVNQAGATIGTAAAPSTDNGIFAFASGAAEAGNVSVTDDAATYAANVGINASANGTGTVTVQGAGAVTGGTGISAKQSGNAAGTNAGVTVGGTGATTGTAWRPGPDHGSAVDLFRPDQAPEVKNK